MRRDVQLVRDQDDVRRRTAGVARRSRADDDAASLIAHVLRQAAPPGAGAMLSLQHSAGNIAVARLLGQPSHRAAHTGTPVRVQRCGDHACPPEGCERDAGPVAQRDTSAVALTDAQAEQLARRPSLAIPRWNRLTQDQRGVVAWKMISAYGPDFTTDFLDYADGNKKPNLSTTISNSASLTPKVLTAQGYRLAGSPGGVELWVHPSGHEIQVMSRTGPAPEEPADCGNAAVDCLTDSDDSDSCRECCDTQYANDQRCRGTCRAGCENKL